MTTVKISTKVDSVVWDEFKVFAKASHQNVSVLLTEAISEYLGRRQVQPVSQDHLADSMDENDELGKLLTK